MISELHIYLCHIGSESCKKVWRSKGNYIYLHQG